MAYDSPSLSGLFLPNRREYHIAKTDYEIPAEPKPSPLSQQKTEVLQVFSLFIPLFCKDTIIFCNFVG